jgi:hypothetical protein
MAGKLRSAKALPGEAVALEAETAGLREDGA